MKKKSLLLVSLFSAVTAFGQSPRLELMEEFTQAKKQQAARQKQEEDGRALAAARLEKLKKNRPPRLK